MWYSHLRLGYMLASPQIDIMVSLSGLSSEHSPWWSMQPVRTPGRAAMDA